MVLFSIVVALLALAAAAGFALSALVPTRHLGWGAAAICALGALLIGIAPLEAASPSTLLTLGDAVFSINTGLGEAERGLAVGLLGAAAAAFLALAAALAAPVRGFGAMIAWALLALVAALASLAGPSASLIHPLSWSIAALAGHAAVRASGVLSDNQQPPYGVILGLLASALLLGTQIGLNPTLSTGDPPPTLAIIGSVVAVLLLTGAAPFALARPEALAAPAPLAVLLHALVLPTLGLTWMVRLVAEQPMLPYSWPVALGVSGTATALAAAAGAASTVNLRAVLNWLVIMQVGLVLAAIGMADPIALVAALALILTLMFSSVAGAVAVSALERSTGSDNYTAAGARLPGVGVIWLAAMAAMLGLPPFLGAWGRLWLFESALAIFPWLLPALLAASVLALLAALAPLSRFWGGTPDISDEVVPGRLDWLAGGFTMGTLLVLGIAPQLAWNVWLRGSPNAPASVPFTPDAQMVIIGGGAILIGLTWLLIRAPSARTLPNPTDTPPTRGALAALSTNLAPLVALGRPTTLLGALWIGLDRLSRGMRVIMLAFEQRYYLLGVLMALIVVMLLMAQL